MRLVRYTFVLLMGLIVSAVISACAGKDEAPANASLTVTQPVSFQSSAMQLNLSPDNTFVLRQGKIDSVGRWKLSDDKAFVLLDARREALVVFQVVKDGLVFAPDQRPTDQVLRQQEAFVPLYPKMRWIGLYRYMADAASFEDCASGKRYPVEMVKDHLALERAYLKNRTEAGAPLRVMFEGEVLLRPPMEGNRDIPTMQVTQFIRVMDEPSCQPAFQSSH